MARPDIVLAAVAGAHGVRGEVRLKLFGEGMDSLRQHKEVKIGERMLTLVALTGSSAAPVARFAEIGDRNAAEALRGTLVSVPRAALPPLGEGEYYHADLIGLPCEGAAGEELGIVTAVENFGAGDILQIERPNGKRAMVPFREGIAEWEGERIVVDPAFLT